MKKTNRMFSFHFMNLLFNSLTAFFNLLEKEAETLRVNFRRFFNHPPAYTPTIYTSTFPSPTKSCYSMTLYTCTRKTFFFSATSISQFEGEIKMLSNENKYPLIKNSEALINFENSEKFTLWGERWRNDLKFIDFSCS